MTTAAIRWSPVGRCFSRDIVAVDAGGLAAPLFYRSTGRNSGQPGVWFPFFGIALITARGAWFDKGDFGAANGGLHRFGTPANRTVSEMLSLETIPALSEVSPREVNRIAHYAQKDEIMLIVWGGADECEARLDDMAFSHVRAASAVVESA